MWVEGIHHYVDWRARSRSLKIQVYVSKTSETLKGTYTLLIQYYCVLQGSIIVSYLYFIKLQKQILIC